MPEVTFDRKSLKIDGERKVVLSGSMHYYRLPYPDMWRHRLRLMKEIGIDTVDLYFYWGYHSPAPGEYDFSGCRDVDLLLDMVEEEGLYLMARPGPYICSEVDGGGFPGWLIANKDMKFRCRQNGEFVYDEEYMKHVREWYEQIVPKIAKRENLLLFQIENEYHFLPTPKGIPLAIQKQLQTRFSHMFLFNLQMIGPFRKLMHFVQRQSFKRKGYKHENRMMKELYAWARELGVTVPIFHNDIESAMNRMMDADIVGIDDYPVKTFDVEWRGKPHVWGSIDLMEEGHAAHGKKCPLLVGEIQGGWFDCWGGKGYDLTRRRLGPQAMDITLKSALAQGAGVISVFMTCGGTTWGYTGSPDVYTSFDYGAPVTEGGLPSARSRAMGAFAEFVKRNEAELAEAVPGPPLCEYKPEMFCRARRAPSGKRFIFFRNSTEEAQPVKVGEQRLTIPPDNMSVLAVSEDNEIVDRCDPATDTRDHVLRKTPLPKLEKWTFGLVNQPLDPDFDDSNWDKVPPGGALDIDSLGYYYGCVWYRGRLKGAVNNIKLDARHCWAAYINGRFLRAFDNHRNRLANGDDMAEKVSIKVPAAYRREEGDVLTVLAESLGHTKGFFEDTTNPRGIASIETGGVDVEWRTRGGLVPGESGMTPRVDFDAMDIAGEKEVELPHQWPSALHGVGVYRTTFELDMEGPDNPPIGLYLFTAYEKANIYLNGWLIGRYWESVGPQKVFYLPSGLLNLQGENSLAVALWRWEQPSRISKMHLTMYP